MTLPNTPPSILTPLPGLPGQLTLAPGHAADYHALSRFHYRPGPPATWAAIWTITYTPENHEFLISNFKSEIRTSPARPVAVAVLSWPVLNLPLRNKLLHLTNLSPKARATFLNQNVRTISRVSVHPQFRSLGLAVTLVRCLCYNCPTRYVDALAAMARAHRFFDLAGMTRHNPPPQNPQAPIYFLLDKQQR